MNPNEKVIRRGKIGGLVCLLLVIPYTLISITGAFYPENLILAATILAMEIVVYLTYAVFLFGILGLARERAEERFAGNVRYLILVYVAMCALVLAGAYFEIASPKVALGMVILLFASFVAFGVISIRLAKDFERLVGEYGESARKAARWNKLSGYLMASVVLSVFGAILSLVADYFMWRVLQKRAAR